MPTWTCIHIAARIGLRDTIPSQGPLPTVRCSAGCGGDHGLDRYASYDYAEWSPCRRKRNTIASSGKQIATQRTFIQGEGTMALGGPRPSNHVGLDLLAQSKHALPSLCLDLWPISSQSCKPEPSSGVAICSCVNHVPLHPEYIQYHNIRPNLTRSSRDLLDPSQVHGLSHRAYLRREIKLLLAADEKKAMSRLDLVHSAKHDGTLDNRTKRTEQYRTLTNITPGLS